MSEQESKVLEKNDHKFKQHENKDTSKFFAAAREQLVEFFRLICDDLQNFEGHMYAYLILQLYICIFTWKCIQSIS